MIATHNVKVNGRWYTPGQEVPEDAPEQMEMAVADEPAVPEEPKVEPKTAKPRTAARRKTK